MTRTRAGFTLVEVLVATLITGMALSAVSWTLVSSAQAKAILRNDPRAFLLAREVHELAESLPRAPSGVVGVRLAADARGLDSLHGAVFSPPARADRTVDSALAGWSQHVALEVCLLDDRGTPTGESPTLGLARDAARLYRLTVTIRHDGADVDRFDWWLAP